MDLQFLLNKNRSRLEGLRHPVKEYAEQLVINCWLRGVYIVITQGFRSIAYQNQLYSIGRRGIPGEKKVTNAKGGSSVHNYGYAIDFALLLPDGKNVSWDMKKDMDKDNLSDWMEVVEEAKKLGFKWGGEFKSIYDPPHLEMTFGHTVAQMRAGILPPERVVAVKYPANFKQVATVTSNAPVFNFLDKGDKGQAVKELQMNLVGLGYNLTVDGDFGEKTDIAVRDFQAKNGLEVDGVVGKATQAKIEELRKKQKESKPAAAPTKPAAPALTLQEVFTLMANSGLKDWEIKNGVDGINILVREGIINQPDEWKDKLDQPVPNWLFFALMGRLIEKVK